MKLIGTDKKYWALRAKEISSKSVADLKYIETSSVSVYTNLYISYLNETKLKNLSQLLRDKLNTNYNNWRKINELEENIKRRKKSKKTLEAKKM
jgi:hypothetical protein